jgi:Type I restriction modification DNA specificity domain
VVKVSDIFTVGYGTKLNFKTMEPTTNSDPDGVRFVSRSSKNLGVVSPVKIIGKVAPLPAGVITVTLGGTYLLSAFVQPHPFYTAQNVAVLTPKIPMSNAVKMFYCICIGKNRFKYSAFGREANRTLKSIEIPERVPQWIAGADVSIDRDMERALGSQVDLSSRAWRWFKYTDIFDIKKGERVVNADLEEGVTPCIRPIEFNNGVDGYINHPPNHPGNTITVSYNGSVGEAFYQPIPYFALDDINVLYPLFDMNPFTAMFLVPLIRKERYRFSYGRKWNVGRMKESEIKLPSTLVSGSPEPDWKFMEEFIRGLPYSSAL